MSRSSRAGADWHHDGPELSRRTAAEALGLARFSPTRIQPPEPGIRVLSLVRAMMRVRRTNWAAPLAVNLRVNAAISWILNAIDCTQDGGIPAHFDLLRGQWAPSYPETSGYTIETLLACDTAFGRPELRQTALDVADYLLLQRTEEGAVGHWKEGAAQPVAPVVFDTGQVIFGWLGAWRETGSAVYLEAAETAGAWLLEIQDSSGAWIRYQHQGTVKVFDTRVAWALLKLAEATSEEAYIHGALRNLDWALQQQQPNGWFRKASFLPGQDPFTHTIAYAAEGLLESGICVNERHYIEAAEKVGRVMLDLQRPDGWLASTYNESWQATARSSCLTGNCQMALIWLRLYRLSGDRAYLNAARKAVGFVASTQDLHTSNSNIRGGIAGSWPIYGRYARFRYPNWAAKFFVDALLALEEMQGGNQDGEGGRGGTGGQGEGS